MTLYKYVDGVTSEMTLEEEADFRAKLPEDPPRFLKPQQFYDQLDDQGQYVAFQTWLSSQDNKTKIYFNHADGFLENDSKITAAMTALSLTTSVFFDAALV